MACERSSRISRATGRVALLCAALVGACSGEVTSEPDDADPEAAVRDYVENLDRICRVVRACYPDQPDDPTDCVAPADEDRTAAWRDASLEKDRVEACLDTIEDREALARWARCILASVDRTVRCLESCPASAEACTLAGNERVADCDEGQGFDRTHGLCIRSEEPP